MPRLILKKKTIKEQKDYWQAMFNKYFQENARLKRKIERYQKALKKISRLPVTDPAKRKVFDYEDIALEALKEKP